MGKIALYEGAGEEQLTLSVHALFADWLRASAQNGQQQTTVL